MFVNKQQTKIIDYLRIRIEYCYQKVRTYIFPTLIDNFTCVNWYHIVRTIISNFDTPFAYIIPQQKQPPQRI